jgi:hypothetical protein
MIAEVRLEGSTFAEPPSRFEAGTPAIAEAIGLGAACDYLTGLGMERVAAHERELGAYLYDRVGGWVGGGGRGGGGRKQPWGQTDWQRGANRRGGRAGHLLARGGAP